MSKPYWVFVIWDKQESGIMFRRHAQGDSSRRPQFPAGTAGNQTHLQET